MKVLAFVDLHESSPDYRELKKKVKKEKPDVVLCAGDFTMFGHGTKKWLRKISKLGKVFLVHGNHEDGAEVRNVCKKYKINFIHKKIVKYKDVVFVGWGGGGFSMTTPKLEEWMKDIKKEMKEYKKMKKVFLVHAPFYKTSLDKLDRDHLGNKTLTKFIKKFKVDVGICGHFHENAEKKDKIRKCSVYNPGPSGKIIEI